MSGLLDGLKPGSVVRARNWDHHQGNGRFTFNTGDRKTVAVFLLLGNEPRDENEPQLDLEKRMNDLGWFKKET
jgi:hypothetical protein